MKKAFKIVKYRNIYVMDKKYDSKLKFLQYFEAYQSDYHQILIGAPQIDLLSATSCFLAAYLVQAAEDSQFCQALRYQNGSKGLMWHYINQPTMQQCMYSQKAQE